LAVEIVSPSDTPEATWSEKLAQYRRSGIAEVVRFDPADAAQPLRLWDRLEGDLVERQLTGENALLCDTLGLHWCVRTDATLGCVLRLSRDALGEVLVLTALEAERARVAELEAELRRR
jgi:Uma2 family endonuclease